MKKYKLLYILPIFFLASCGSKTIKVDTVYSADYDSFKISDVNLNSAKKSVIYLAEDKISPIHYHYNGVCVKEDLLYYYFATVGRKTSNQTLKLTTGIDNNGNRFDLSYVGTDSKNEIAVYKTLKINKDFVVASQETEYAKCDNIMSISTPYASNSDLGTLNMLRTGLISNVYNGYFSTTLNLSITELGAPIFNEEGKMLGITHQVISDDGAKSGDVIDNHVVSLNMVMNYSMLNGITSDIIDSGKDVERGLLGVTVTNYELIEGSKLAVVELDVPHVAVTNVGTGSPAQRAGIEPGFVLVSIDNNILNRMSDLSYYLSRKNKGDKVVIEFIDFDKKSHKATVTLW